MVTRKSAAVPPQGYALWLAEVKQRVRAAQQRAALAVNSELLRLYWHLGNDLLQRQARESWGSGIIAILVLLNLSSTGRSVRGFR